MWEFLPPWTHFCGRAGSSARTLNTEHLSYFERGSSDVAQGVDYSLGVGLGQERRVQQSIPVWKTHGRNRNQMSSVAKRQIFNVEARWREQFVKAVPNVNRLRSRGQLKKGAGAYFKRDGGKEELKMRRSEKSIRKPSFCLPPSDCFATSAMVPMPSPTARPSAQRQNMSLRFI